MAEFANRERREKIKAARKRLLRGGGRIVDGRAIKMPPDPGPDLLFARNCLIKYADCYEVIEL